MSKFLSILREEFRRFANDQGVLLIIIVGVIAYMFCYALPYYKEIIKEAPVAIVNFDNSEFSRNFIRNLNATDAIDIKEELTSIKEAEKELNRGNIRGFIVLPRDFEKDILRGKQVQVLFYSDTSYLIIYKTIYSALVDTSGNMAKNIEIAGMMKQGIPKKQAIALAQPFEFVRIPLFNAIGGYKSYVYPVILVLIMHQTLVLGIGMVQGTRNEKKRKYCKELKDIPITLFARSTMYVLIYLVYGAVAFLIFPQVFSYPMYYNILPLFLIYFLMLYTAAFFAQTISYFFKIREAAILILIASSLIFIFIPGLIWPRESIPMFVNAISFLIPATCGIDGIIKINQNGASFINIIYDYAWLAILCAFYFIMAVYLTRKSDKEYS